MIHLNSNVQFTRFDSIQPKRNEEVETTTTEKAENKELEKKEVKYDSAKVAEYMNGFYTTLKEMNCQPEQFGIILNTVANEINNYYAANGENGLTEHLNELFDKLVNTYVKNNSDNSVKKEESENQTTTSEEKTINYEQKFENLQNKLDNIQNKIGKIGQDFINDIEVPVQPNEKNYIGRNGKLDKVAYEQAMKEYNQAFADYQRAKNEYNIKVAELQNEADKIKNEMNSVMFEASTSKIEEKINELRELGDNDSADKLLEKLNNQKDKFNDYLKQESEANNKEYDLNVQLNQLIEPTKPSIIDYMDANGNINETEYNNAMVEYKNAKQDFDKSVNDINKQINGIYNQIKYIQNITEYSRNITTDLYNTATKLCSTKEQIENIKDPDLKVQLQETYNKFVEKTLQYATINERYNDVYNEIISIEIPVYPDKEDFIVNGNFNETEYNKAIDNYTNARSEYNTEINKYDQMLRIYQEQTKKLELESAALELDCKDIAEFSDKLNQLQDTIDNTSDPVLKSQLQDEYKELKKLGQISISLKNSANELSIQSMSKEIPVWPSKIDFTYTDKNGSTVVDEQAYENAIQKYYENILKYTQELDKNNLGINSYMEQNCIVQLRERSIANTIEIIGEYSKKLDNIQNEINKASNPEEKEKLQIEYERILNLEKEAIETSKKADDTYISTFEFVPVPPQMSDFTYVDGNGNFICDEKSYEIAMKEYETEMENYNKKIVEFQNQSDNYNKQLEEINNRADVLYNKGNNLQLDAENYKIEIEAQQISQKRMAISTKIIELQEQQFNYEKPVQPVKSDFTYTDRNGNLIFDEKAYNNAMTKYNKEITEYQNEYNNIQNKLDTYTKLDKTFENKLNLLQNQRDQLLNYQESLNQIQNAIRKESDSEKKANLKEKYEKASDLIKNNIENNHKINELEIKRNELEIPVEPDISDFTDNNGIIDRKAYIRAMRTYNIDKSFYDTQMLDININLENLNNYKRNYEQNIKALLN